MSIIQFKEANCKNCYKCIRNCPVKAIAFVNDQARIVENECMLCGNCLTICPQNAKSVGSEVETVKGFIRNGEKVHVSLAPSFISAFENTDDRWLYAALKRLGFTHIEETAIGAAQVSKEYDRLINENRMKNIITTCCHSINLLVQKYYPQLVDQLAPVVSPMIAHAKMLRETYGSGIRVVFIGPCLSKKDECNDLQNDGVIDAVITFEELDAWLADEGIDNSTDLSREVTQIRELNTRIYPVPGGILETLENRRDNNYHCVSVDGVERCIQVLDSIKNDSLHNYFIEMNSCAGGCIAGPCTKRTRGGFLEARERLIAYKKHGLKKEKLPGAKDELSGNKDGLPGARDELQGIKDETLQTQNAKVNLKKVFFDLSKKDEAPSEAVIQGILNSIGKFTPDKELNCGACGYSSCRDKAAAVYHNKAQLHMCLPYMRERAESISNLIINTTPSAIFALDKELLIQEVNFSAKKMFQLSDTNPEGKSIFDVLACADFRNVIDNVESVYDKKYYYEKYDMTVEQSIIFVPEHNVVVAIIKDITHIEKNRQQMHHLREENAELAQKVIEKQMRVAQEIASLLGETTAETKVVLTKLKKSIMSEMGDEQ